MNGVSRFTPGRVLICPVMGILACQLLDPGMAK